MTRRVLPLLLAVLVLAGITAETCPQGRCPTMRAAPASGPAASHGAMSHDAMHGAHQHGDHAGMQAVAAAAAHDCCDREGLTRPPCCPTIQLGPAQSAPAASRASDVVQLAAAQPAPFALLAPALVRRDTPRRFDPGAPPGTLIEQHTSLLV